MGVHWFHCRQLTLSYQIVFQLYFKCTCDVCKCWSPITDGIVRAVKLGATTERMEILMCSAHIHGKNISLCTIVHMYEVYSTRTYTWVLKCVRKLLSFYTYICIMKYTRTYV